MRKKTLITILILSAIMLAACGGGAVAEEAEVPAETDAPATTEAPAESVKPELPSQPIGPQLPEGTAQPLTCSSEGYTEMLDGDVLRLVDPTETKTVATIERIDESLVYTFIETGESFTEIIPFGDQSQVLFRLVELPVPLSDETTMYATFMLLVCGDHLYAPFERDSDGTFHG